MSQQLPFKQTSLSKDEVLFYTEEIQSFIPMSKILIGGGIARGKLITSDIDLLIQALPNERKPVEDVVKFLGWRPFQRSDYKTAFSIKKGDKYYVLDLFFSGEESWGNASLFIVGSREWNDCIRARLKLLGFHWKNANYFTSLDDEWRFCYSTEQEALDFVQLRWVPPEQRVAGYPIVDQAGNLVKYL